MDHITKHLSILGTHVKDRITGIEGVATSVSFDLYGCIQVIVHPGVDKDGKPREQCWFDIARLEITSRPRAMPVPDFLQGPVAEGKKGPAEKPPAASRIVQGMIALVCMVFLAGCTTETRTTWEQCPQHRHLTGTEVPAAEPNTTRVVYPDRKPVQSFSSPGQPQQTVVRFEDGIHVNTYDANGDLVSHTWQRSQELAP